MDTGQHTPEPEDSPHQQPPLGVGSSPTSNNSTLSAQPSQLSKDVQSPSATEELQASRLCSSLGSMTPEDTPALATDPQGSVDLSVRSSDLPGSGIKSLESSRCDRCGWESDDPRHLTGHVCQKGRYLRSVATPSKGSTERDVSDSSSVSDVETFTGKIVYNPDGSAYIIEGADSECSDEECSLDLPQQEGSIVDARGMTPPQLRVFPQVVNAFHISRNPTLYGALYGQAYSLLQEKSKVPEVPIMHSYRVFSLRNRQSDSASDDSKENRNSGPNKRPGSADKTSFPILEYASVPIKPILMCFICKLSFGYAKSFIAHALSEHNLALNDDERRIMSQKNTSAIIQGVGKEKEPIISFLEPVPSSAAKMSGAQKLQGGFLTQSVPSNSSFAATDPVTSLLNVVSSSVSCGSIGGAAAVTTVVSASTSPLPSVLDIKPSLGESQKDDPSSSSFPSRTPPSAVAASEGEETLAPELADLANIEKLAKAAAAAAESGAPSPSLSSENVPKLSSRHDSSAEGAPSDHDIRRSPAMLSLERPTSSGSMGCISPGASVSPKVLPSSSPLAPTSHSPSTPTGTMIGLCAQHPDGKTNGVECPKCDMILGSSRSLGGHMTMMHSRNSCKTLKCPKCNWHYKYQETLEIHMKEKHPENEMNCLYCLTNQPHPRLARGETYTCGYKPYRCEVCNYSTTTKGNLSIHMQSDKHINNVQELQNGNLSAEHLLPPQNLPGNTPISDPAKKPGPSTKPKATWRCDVCNYETNVARNLRIHMTSEKHTHNMMVLQQNVKHMQQLTALQQAQAQAQALDPLFQFHPGLLLPCSDTQLPPEAALADMAYNHALLMMASQQQQQQQRALAAAAAAAAAAGKGPLGGPLNLTSSPTVDLDHPDPTFHLEAPYDDASRIFQCCICNSFSADSVEALNQHLQQDRTRQREDEVLMAVAGSYICKLCSYKTNLKANFQLHCKTDKHLQRLQHVNHVKEGGARNEWKLKYVNVSNPVQVRCNACDYYTNSIHKLQMHTTNPRHEAGSKIFLHLQISETMVKSESKYYFCTLCNFPARTKMSLVQHIHSLQHLRNENLRQMQHKGERRDVEEELKEMFQVKEYTGNDKLFEASMGMFIYIFINLTVSSGANLATFHF